MDHILIRGGRPLRGTLQIAGSKNAALPIMAACLLTDEAVTLEDVPRVADVTTLSRVLEGLGVSSIRLPTGAMHLQVTDASRHEADAELVRRMRASFCVLGPLVARRGYANVALPGGCRIGDRPVDLHLKGLAALGAEIDIQDDRVIARARRLRGTSIYLGGLRGSTVTGTCNVMSAAVLAEGDTVIEGAAREPEVVDVGQFLRRLGANIHGLGTARILIKGVPQLAGTSHRVIPDRIEAATLMAAAAVTRGHLQLLNVRRSHLTAVISKLREIGLTVDAHGTGGVTVHADRRLAATRIIATPYPGIPTDVQAQLTTLLTITPGISQVRDTVFPSRFQHVAELQRMGAQIRQSDGNATVCGVPSLVGAEVFATDLRASAALILAGLAARGDTIVREIHHLDRGYERLDEKLSSVGAAIERRTADAPERRAA